MAISLSTMVVLLLSCTSAISSPISSSSPEEMAQENLKKLAVANNEMALKLLNQLSARSAGNIFFSPFSLSSAFAMLYYGTKGKSAKELRRTLGYDAADLGDDVVHQTFRRYLTDVLPSHDNDSYVLISANAVLLDKKLHLFPSYRRDVQDLYQALVQEVDFGADSARISKDINKWAEEKTDGRIKELSDRIDPATAFILMNAVYFKGTWYARFDPNSTTRETFYNNGVEAKKVWTMKRSFRVPYTRDFPEFQAIEMLYEGKNVSMVILLPNQRDGLQAMEKNLTLEKLSEVRRRMWHQNIYITIPRFEIEYSREMSQDFQAIGSREIFGPAADFSGIASGSFLSLDQVYHKAVLEVTEQGTAAVAFTRVSAVFKSGGPPPVFKADHPFFFAIVDKRNDMVLFMGHVTSL